MSATARYREALELIARDGCENYTDGHRCYDDDAIVAGDNGVYVNRTKGARFSAMAWCDSCVAQDALGR